MPTMLLLHSKSVPIGACTLFTLLTFLFAPASPAATDGLQPIGGLSFVNLTTNGEQRNARVAAGPTNGHRATVWESIGQDGSGTGIFARAPLAGEIQVNQTAAGNQELPDIAIRDNGQQFAVAWHDHGTVFARTFDSSGTPLGDEVPVDTSDPQRPALAYGPDGNITVAWVESGSVRMRRLKEDGTPTGTSRTVEGDPGLRDNVAIAISSQAMLFVWQYAASGTDTDIHGTLMEYGGQPIAADFAINLATSAGPHEQPAASVDPDGDFLIVWGGLTGRGRAMLQNGTLAIQEFFLPVIAGHVDSPSVDHATDGTVVASWWRQFEGVEIRCFTPLGLPLGLPIGVSQTLSSAAPDLAFESGNVLSLVWDDLSLGDRDGFLVRYGLGAAVGVGPGPVASTASLRAAPTVFSTRTSFLLDGIGGGTIDIHDVQGRRVRSFEVQPGAQRLEWDARDARGRDVGAGVFFVRARHEDEVSVTKITRIH